ncbi:hypothetical protein [Tepidibacter formicigenes]|jgi:hypothetical protein|uniref:Uncharacterized protein n=1 Tax=Tepidibacter formicigenes DSM 15518 TaxID=1123349 RepID=A0A1M6MHH2_9FIRM|nr:hypothetical protein [Tepidibacter formicigenes]SHJ82904.1 hypothetical protein SAMN02744037_00946 [Tepidibacter formicigenes DSM 15518]
MGEKVIVLEDTITKMKLDYLYNGNEKYLKFCKKLYGIDCKKWNSYFWELYIVKLFEEEIKEKLIEILNANDISQKISKDTQEERERIIVYNYIQGYIFGYNNLDLTKKLDDISRKVFLDKKANKIHISEIMRSRYMRNYNEFINIELEKTDNKQGIQDIVYRFCVNGIYPKLKKVNFNNSSILIKNSLYNIVLKDCIEKNREGIWDGIISKVIKTIDKKYKIIM